MSKVKITNLGIKRALNTVSAEDAVVEYIWNGFDASATKLEITYTLDSFDNITSLSIIDNGKGIPFDLLDSKFAPFWESEKAIKKSEDNAGLKGKDGYGRLTFFKFTSEAKWTTVYGNAKGEMEQYSIQIKSSNLDDYEHNQPEISDATHSGTTVVFTGFGNYFHEKYFENKLLPHIISEFAWFLELNSDKGYQIIAKGEPLPYEHLIAEKEEFRLEHPNELGQVIYNFQCRYVRWTQKMNDEFSRFYFVNNQDKFKYKTTTKLNKKGDQFYHSVVVKSDFFENFALYDDGNDGSNHLFSETEDYRAYRELIKNLQTYLKKKRKPFLRDYAHTLIAQYEYENVMPQFETNPWDKVRKAEFEALVKELYEVEPALFVKLNFEQKKTFLNLLNLLLDTAERDDLFVILSGVVELDPEDREQLSKILQTTRLQNIIKSIKLVHDRILALDHLKQIVFDHSLLANEKDHLQKAIENHYWIFGEEYNMVCAAEVRFEKALRRYLYLLRGIDEKTLIDSPGKNKEMDIFLVRQDYGKDKLSNVVVELKNPTTIKRLTIKELSQVKDYMNTILAVDEFNSSKNSTWDFYLVGQDYDDAVANEISNSQHHGEKDLAFKLNNNKISYKIYVKKWSEIFIDVELRLKWLNNKLLIEREKLSAAGKTLENTMDLLESSTAVQPSQVISPSEN